MPTSNVYTHTHVMKVLVGSGVLGAWKMYFSVTQQRLWLDNHWSKVHKTDKV